MPVPVQAADSVSTVRAMELAGSNVTLWNLIKFFNADPKILQAIEKQCQFLTKISGLPDTRWVADMDGVLAKIPNAVNEQLISCREMMDQVSIKSENEIQMHYAIDNEGNFLRGYFCKDQQLLENSATDKSIIDLLDQTLQVWLASVSLASTDGIIHEIKEGQRPIPATEFELKFEDPVDGYINVARETGTLGKLKLEVSSVSDILPVVGAVG